MINEIRKSIDALVDPIRKKRAPKYFQAFKGGYGEGDEFAGLSMPSQRKIAKEFRDAQYDTLTELLGSNIHEERMIGILILEINFKQKKRPLSDRTEIVRFLAKHLNGVNNWDLTDTCGPHIFGPWMEETGDLQLMTKWADSNELWLQRLAVVSTYAFIRHGKMQPTLDLCEGLMQHEHDMIHKACGWMLRELGNRELQLERDFLDKFHREMPRTMLRYAIEKFLPSERLLYLKGKD